MNRASPVFDISSATWAAAGDTPRAFVKHRNPGQSPAAVWRIQAPGGLRPEVSVVIPTRDADARGCLRRLLAQLERQSLAAFEVIVVRGDPRQGRAINIGADMSSAAYVVTLDDDTSLPGADTLATLVDIMKSHADIGIAGGNCTIPADARGLVRSAMRQIPRRAWKPVTGITDSDLAQHPCMIMRTAEFKAIGGENELIPRGLDPYLRMAMRKTGKRVVLVPGVEYHHLLPDRLGALIAQFHRNGRLAAYVNRFYPQWVIETPGGHGKFNPRAPIVLRGIRLPLRLVASLLTGKMIRFLCESAYAAGFMAGLRTGGEESAPGAARQSPQRPNAHVLRQPDA